jgi:hypothetical protein
MTEQPTLPPTPPAVAGPAMYPMAMVSFIAGLLTWISLPFFYLVVPTPVCTLAAIVCGHMARAQIRRDPAQQGNGFAIAGLILGWAMVLTVLLFVLVAVLFLGGLAALAGYFASHGG